MTKEQIDCAKVYSKCLRSIAKCEVRNYFVVPPLDNDGIKKYADARAETLAADMLDLFIADWEKRQ